MRKRLLALLLAFCMALSCASASAWAAEAEDGSGGSSQAAELETQSADASAEPEESAEASVEPEERSQTAEPETQSAEDAGKPEESAPAQLEAQDEGNTNNAENLPGLSAATDLSLLELDCPSGGKHHLRIDTRQTPQPEGYNWPPYLGVCILCDKEGCNFRKWLFTVRSGTNWSGWQNHSCTYSNVNWMPVLNGIGCISREACTGFSDSGEDPCHNRGFSDHIGVISYGQEAVGVAGEKATITYGNETWTCDIPAFGTTVRGEVFSPGAKLSLCPQCGTPHRLLSQGECNHPEQYRKYTPNKNGSHKVVCDNCNKTVTESEACDPKWAPSEDKSGHEEKCTKCGDIVNSWQPHSAAENSTYTPGEGENHNATCGVCGEQFSEPCTLEYYSGDTEFHYQYCSMCRNNFNQSKNFGPHIYKITKLSDGTAQLTCTVCSQSYHWPEQMDDTKTMARILGCNVVQMEDGSIHYPTRVTLNKESVEGGGAEVRLFNGSDKEPFGTETITKDNLVRENGDGTAEYQTKGEVTYLVEEGKKPGINDQISIEIKTEVVEQGGKKRSVVTERKAVPRCMHQQYMHEYELASEEKHNVICTNCCTVICTEDHNKLYIRVYGGDRHFARCFRCGLSKEEEHTFDRMGDDGVKSCRCGEEEPTPEEPTLEQQIDNAQEGDVIQLDATKGEGEANQAELTKDTVQKLGDSKAEGAEIKLDTGSVKLDDKALGTVANQAQNGENVRVELNTGDNAKANMTDAQKEAAKNAVQSVEVNIKSGDKEIHDLNGGKIELMIPVNTNEELNASYLDENGVKEAMKCSVENMVATVEGPHCSFIILERKTINVKTSFTKSANASKDQSFKLNATAEGEKLSYKSDNKKVTVKNGTVTIKKGFVGKAVITVSAGTQTKKVTVTVNPTATALSGVKADKKGAVTATWKKNATGKGYELEYSTDKTFKNKKAAKTVTISKNKTEKATVKKLKAKTTYYFRIRTVNGKLKSDWSKAKKVTAKK